MNLAALHCLQTLPLWALTPPSPLVIIALVGMVTGAASGPEWTNRVSLSAGSAHALAHASYGSAASMWVGAGVGTGAPQPTIFVGPNGTDGSSCGATPALPCATLAYAVNVVANAVLPAFAAVSISLAAGSYGHASCGVNATRPLNITGAGSGTTVVDCEGSGQRALYTNDSLALGGVTITGSNVSLDVVLNITDKNACPEVVGGGAVWVAHSSNLTAAYASFVDVVWVDNQLAGTLRGSVELFTTGAVMGGPAVLVSGGGFTSVTFDGCLVANNSLMVIDHSGSYYNLANGGGVCVELCGITPSFPGASVVSLSNVVALNNSVTVVTSFYVGSGGGIAVDLWGINNVNVSLVNVEARYNQVHGTWTALDAPSLLLPLPTCQPPDQLGSSSDGMCVCVG